jgi:DNA-binding SARP family transcriptional activator
MQALHADGNDAEAIAAYDALRLRLRDELGTAPSAPTQQLHRALLG